MSSRCGLWAMEAVAQPSCSGSRRAQKVVLPSKARKLLVCLSKMQRLHFSKSIFPLGFSSQFFFSDARILNSWGKKGKKRVGGISNGNPDSLNCFCCLRYSASCNLYGQMPARHLVHAWLLKVQAKGTAVLEYAREEKLSSSAKLLLS